MEENVILSPPPHHEIITDLWPEGAATGHVGVFLKIVTRHQDGYTYRYTSTGFCWMPMSSSTMLAWGPGASLKGLRAQNKIPRPRSLATPIPT